MKPLLLKDIELGYGSYRYFPEQLLPTFPATGRRVVSRPTAYEHNDDIEYFFVRSGQGQLEVNGVRFPLRRGVSGSFTCYQFHRFLPDPGQSLEFDYFRITVGTFHVFWNCPYCYSSLLDMDSPFSTVCFCPQEIPEIEELFDEILMQKNPAKEHQANWPVYLCMEFLGRLHRSPL